MGCVRLLAQSRSPFQRNSRGQLGRQEAVRAFKKLTTDRKRSSRAYRRTPQSTAHGKEQAQRWLKDGLAVTGLIAAGLPRMKGSDPRKLSPRGAASKTDDGLTGMDRDAHLKMQLGIDFRSTKPAQLLAHVRRAVGVPQGDLERVRQEVF